MEVGQRTGQQRRQPENRADTVRTWGAVQFDRHAMGQQEPLQGRQGRCRQAEGESAEKPVVIAFRKIALGTGSGGDSPGGEKVVRRGGS